MRAEGSGNDNDYKDKTMNFQKFLLISISFFLVAAFASPVFAIQPIGPGDIEGRLGIQPPPEQGRSASGLLNVLAGVVRVTYIVFFVLAVMIFLLVAFEYLTSQGEPEKIKKAQDWLIYAAVSVVIALLAVGISTLIQRFLVSPYAGGYYGGGYPGGGYPAPPAPAPQPGGGSPTTGPFPPQGQDRGADAQVP